MLYIKHEEFKKVFPNHKLHREVINDYEDGNGIWEGYFWEIPMDTFPSELLAKHRQDVLLDITSDFTCDREPPYVKFHLGGTGEMIQEYLESIGKGDICEIVE